MCHSTTTFIAHLVNQAVAHEIIALQILVLLLERPTDDAIEIAVGFMREVGAFLAENSPKANATVYERFRAVLNEGNISQRVQYMIEVLMQVRKDKYKDKHTVFEVGNVHTSNVRALGVELYNVLTQWLEDGTIEVSA